MTRQLIVAASLVLFTSVVAAQVTLHVPSQYSTPELAAIAAQSGDTVLVQPGNYVNTLDYFGKAVNVVSAGGPAVTTMTAASNLLAPVCFVTNESSGAILDGFTIQGGTPVSAGGGINVGIGASPVIRNCIIVANTSFAGGGAIACQAGSHPTITNCIMFANTSQNGRGGAMYLGPPNGSAPAGTATLRNCTITANSAITGAPATDTGGIYCDTNATCTLESCIIWGNTNKETNNLASFPTSYSIIEGGNGSGGPFPGPGNIDANPGFANAPIGDFDLTVGSPGQDAGNPAASLPATDCTGSPRIVNFRVDIGAEELFDIFPGSEQDLTVRTSVNGTPGDDPVLQATSTDAYIVRFLSPGGAYDGTIPVLLATAFPTGFSPSNFPGFPELHLDPTLPIVALYNGAAAPPFGFGLLPVGGLTFAYTVPAGQSGMSVQVQGLVLSPNPNNAFFTASNAHRLRIL